MGENIRYIINAYGFKDESEADEFIEFCSEWDGQDGMEYEDCGVFNVNGVEVTFTEGWRGGGKTCKELIKEHFGLWLEKHKHITFKASTIYLDQSPIEVEYEREGENND